MAVVFVGNEVTRTKASKTWIKNQRMSLIKSILCDMFNVDPEQLTSSTREVLASILFKKLGLQSTDLTEANKQIAAHKPEVYAKPQAVDSNTVLQRMFEMLISDPFMEKSKFTKAYHLITQNNRLNGYFTGTMKTI